MAKRMSRTMVARIQQIADHAYAMGAKPPGIDGVKADMSLGEQASAVYQAVSAATQMQSSEAGYVEDIYNAYVIIQIGSTYYRADYTMGEDGAVTLAARDAWVQVEEVWQPVEGAAAKAGLLALDESTATPYASMKAIGDRQIEVKVAYYGHKNGKDAHGEYFSPNTDFDAENFPSPPLLYYHGFDANGKKMGKPAVTGIFQSRRTAADGHYLTYTLKRTRYADLQWASAQQGACVVSPGTIGHLIRKAADGELTYWPLAEISAWDYAANRAPANLHSVAAPVLKALYLSEGLTPPPLIETAASETPEAAGDAASEQAQSGGADLSPDEVARYVVTQVASAVLAKNMRTPTP